jgi:Phosphotransferase system mannitol/fructose-specific IIA domain (Ntr-type)
MDLFKILKKELIIVPLTESSPIGIIGQLVDKFAAYKGLSTSETEAIKDEVIKRESLGSTAMSNGIAIPHAKVDNLEECAVVIGISRLPVDFGGEEKTKVFFLVLAPKDKPGEHVQILASIARACSSSVFVRLLTAAGTPSDVYELFFD